MSIAARAIRSVPPAPPFNFSTNEVVRIAKVSLRQLQWWDERRLVCPAHIGHSRQYSEAETAAVLIVAELKRKQFSVQAIRAVLRRIERALGIGKPDIDVGWIYLAVSPVYPRNGSPLLKLAKTTQELANFASTASAPLALVDLQAIRARITEAKEAQAQCGSK
jgi:DNA-binding transcriptional MerR regulator